jgi:hypothetical protein
MVTLYTHNFLFFAAPNPNEHCCQPTVVTCTVHDNWMCPKKCYLDKKYGVRVTFDGNTI